MINKSKLAIMAAAAAAGVTSQVSKYIRNFGSLLLTMTRCFYDSHMQKVQMRFAPTRRMGVRLNGSQPRRICNTVTFTNPIQSN
jgi:hypothetical protein